MLLHYDPGRPGTVGVLTAVGTFRGVATFV
jgi:hypothetical protein